MMLKHDIRSMFHGVVYAKAGEEVKVISIHGDILIVESETGNRFSIKEDDLTDIYIPPQDPVPEPQMDKVVKTQSTRKKAAAINKQQTLF